ncbi:hypothetical protein RJ639_029013 [Escallonia herrerae]|uniref:N-acetyltransferase domain-containing protein n=1 Tax=Escallonia herrerae TaxID=1293975 RepID=A0AA88X664_9ASTE|nr:hypothetical protein RJ639_029013 [Escallonia herrerae]
MEEIQSKIEDIQLNPGDKETEEDYSDITLRQYDLSDIDDVMVWATDEKVREACAATEKTTTKERVTAYITDVVVPHPWCRAICLKGRPIGQISVMPKTGNDSCRAELGYLIASKYWGKGIVTRAVKLVASTIFIEWPHLARLEAQVHVNNLASERVLEKVGFQREGVLRNHQKLKVNKLGATEMDDEYLDISLRLLDPSNIDDFMVWATDDKVSKFFSWDTYTSKQDAMSFIVNVVNPTRGSERYALKAAQSVPSQSRQMRATRAVEPSSERLEALVDVENSDSQRVLDKAGFKREGVLRKYILLKGRPRDMVVFSLLRSELHCLFEEFNESVTVIDKRPKYQLIYGVRMEEIQSKVEDIQLNLGDKGAEEDYSDITMSWAICLKGRPIGQICVMPKPGNDGCKAELGYLIASKYWGKGIITRAVKLVASTIFIEWPHLARLEALVHVANPASQRVLEKE